MSVISCFACPAWILMMFLDLLKDFDLIKSCFHVMRTTLLNFDGNISIVLEVFAEPDCREMSPTKFLDHNVSANENLTDVDWMVPTDLIVFYTLVLGVVVLVELNQELV